MTFKTCERLADRISVRGPILLDEFLGAERSEVRKSRSQLFVSPVPPCELEQRILNLLREPKADDFCRYADDHGERRHVLGYDSPGSHCSSSADTNAGQYRHSMTDPDIILQHDFVRAAPVEETLIVLFAQLVTLGAIAEMVQRHAVQRMVAGIEPRLCSD